MIASLVAPVLTAVGLMFSPTTCATTFCNINEKVVQIVGPQGGWGSGAIVSEDGWVLTAKHVATMFEANQPVHMYTNTGKHYIGKVVVMDKDRDQALIKIDNATKLPFLALAESAPTKFEVNTAWGWSGGKFAPKHIAYLGPIKLSNGDDMLYTKGINAGDSGGPILNKKNEIVGIVVAKFTATNEGIGVAVENVYQMLRDNNVALNGVHHIE
jgi:serine protease Do